MKPLETKIQQIQSVIAAHQNLERACQKAREAGCLTPDGPLDNAIWFAFQEMLDLIDHRGWISWFIHDNQSGKRGMVAGTNGDPRPIRTVRQLAQLILEEQQ